MLTVQSVTVAKAGFAAQRVVAMNTDELVTSFFERVYNQRDLDYVMELFAETYFEHTETGARSNAECRAIIESTCATPDLRVEINELISHGDTVATRLTFTGIHRGEFFGIPATHKEISFEAMEFFR